MYNSQTTLNRINNRLWEQEKQKKDLNEFCKISKNTLNQSTESKYGVGASILYDAADFLECTTDYLLGRTDKPNVPADYLTNDEQRILSMYRALTPTEQANIAGRLETLTELHEQTKKQDA